MKAPRDGLLVGTVFVFMVMAAPLQGQEDEHHDVTGKFVEEGFFENSIKIPGTEVSFRFGGYVKLDLILDFDPIGNNERFQTKTIPVEGTDEALFGGGFNMHPKQSRFSLDFRSETSAGLFRAYFEMDFFGDNTVLRLRHAYGVLGHLLAGATWSTFMDVSAQPITVDFEASEPFVFVLRQPLLRWEQPVGKHWRWGVAIEQPSPMIELPEDADGEARNTMPDFVTRTRWQRNGSHIQFAGVVRQLRVDNPEPNANVTAVGWGLNLTGRWAVYGKDDLRAMIAYGQGISRYVKGLGGQELDAVLTPDGDLDVIPGLNYTLAYLHWWTPTLRSSGTFGVADLYSRPAQADEDIGKLWSWHVNLIWSPWRLVNVGTEFMQGRRINKDGDEGTANRVQVAVQFKLP